MAAAGDDEVSVEMRKLATVAATAVSRGAQNRFPSGL
jgi:hypothetical protein